MEKAIRYSGSCVSAEKEKPENIGEVVKEQNVGVLILAGGKAVRFGRDKLSLTLNGRNLVQIALDKYTGAFQHVALSSNVWPVVNYKFGVLPAAASKELSILTGLEHFEFLGIDKIILAEAARPFTVKKHVDLLVDFLKHGSNAIISGFPSWETIYLEYNEEFKVLPRAGIHIGQTPEGWDLNVLRFAIQKAMHAEVEAAHSFATMLNDGVFTLDFVEGTRSNIKVTYPIDALIAQAIAKEHPDYLFWGSDELQSRTCQKSYEESF